MPTKLIVGVTDLSFHRVTASLITNVLQDMGFIVERNYSPHEENFRKLKTGEVDALTSAWLPSSHGAYKENVEESVPLLDLGLHYEPYALWGVPDYVPADAVTLVTDLLKPDVLDKMRRTIQGITPGAGITRFSIKIMDKYGLNNAGYTFLTGTEKDCVTTFEKAVENKEWAVVPLWKPQFLHYRYAIRELVEPKGLLGIVDTAVMLLREDKSSLFTSTQLETLDSLRFSNDIIAELDYKVCRDKLDIDQVCQHWLERNGFLSR